MGRIVIGDSALQITDSEKLVKLVGLKEIRDFYDPNGLKIDIVNFRLKRAIVSAENQIIHQVDLTGSQNAMWRLTWRKIVF